jgi:hypothetical protein
MSTSKKDIENIVTAIAEDQEEKQKKRTERK